MKSWSHISFFLNGVVIGGQLAMFDSWLKHNSLIPSRVVVTLM